MQFRLIPTIENEPGSLEVKFHLIGLKPYTNYTIWCRSVGVNGDVSPSTKPVHFVTEQEGKKRAFSCICMTLLSKRLYVLIVGRLKLKVINVYCAVAPSSPPLKIQASAISNAAVSVSWEQPLQTNGPITVRLLINFVWTS